jgi:hypothetical protein
MGTFGAGVSALLETYDKCLSLLKAFKGNTRADAEVIDPELHSQLRSSIRSDRTRVHKAYAARLYRDGNRLSKGDCENRTEIR